MFVAVLLTIFAASGAIAATLSGPANIAEPASLSKMPTFMRPIPQAAVRPLRMQDLRSQYPNGTKIIMPVENLRETATPEQLSAAEGIESVLVKQMIDEMRKSVPENDLVPLSQGERIFRAMLDDEYAKVISGQGQLGISDLVLAELKGKR